MRDAMTGKKITSYKLVSKVPGHHNQEEEKQQPREEMKLEGDEVDLPSQIEISSSSQHLKLTDPFFPEQEYYLLHGITKEFEIKKVTFYLSYQQSG